MNLFIELQKIRDDYNKSLNDKMNEISIDALFKIGIQIGDRFIPFGYDKGNAIFVLKENFKEKATVNFTNGEDKISIRFVGDTICSDGTVYEKDEVYCCFSLNNNLEWVIKDNRFEYIESK